jgi:DHA2 family multidrug resistance protein
VIFFLPLVQTSLGNIPKENYAKASGLFNFIRILVGSGFGTSLSIELWTRREIFYHARLAELFRLDKFTILEPGTGSAFADGIALRLMDREIERQAFMLATNDLSWLAAWIFLLLAPLPLLCRKIESNQKAEPVEA